MHVGNYVTPGLTDYLVGIGKYVVFAALLIAVAIALYNKCTPFNDFVVMFHDKNAPYTVARIGFLGGSAIALDALISYKISPLPDFIWLFAGGIAAFALLFGIDLLARRFLGIPTSRYCMMATAIVQAAVLVAAGLIVAGGFSTSAPTQGKAVLSMVVFVPQALLTLLGAYWLADRKLNLNAKLRAGDNAAAELAAGILIAAGFVLKGAVGGQYVGILGGEFNFVITAALTLVLLALALMAADKWVFTEATLSSIVAENQELPALFAAASVVVLGYGLGNVAF